MQKCIALIAATVLCVALFYIAPLTFPTPPAPMSTELLDSSTYKLFDSSTHSPIDLLTLNAPLLTILGPDGNEIVLQDGVECETFFFGGTANEFAAVGLDRIDLNIVRAIKAAGNDANLNISADRRNARLKNGQTVYYGAKIKPPARGKVTGVTFVLTTVPTSGVPDIVNNSFNIKYVESVGGRAGDVKSGSTSGKAYQVINPAGDFLYYFSFTAVVNSGGIQTTIVPHYFGGAMVRGITPDRVQCCCAHTKKPLPRVPEITYSCWYGFAHISNWFVSCFRACLAKAVCANTANVPCEGPEATGIEITITGDGFERIKNELTPDRIKITDEQGSVARVTQITEITNTTIKAKMDITACRPGVKTVKIEGAGGFTTLTLIKIVQDVPDTIVGQRRVQATRILGTQEKLALTTTLSPGADGKQNIVFADAKYQVYNVTCVTRNGDTTATTTTTGGCNNIATTVVQGTCTPGAGEDNVTVSGPNFTCTAPTRNADINLTTDIDGKNGIEPAPTSGDEANNADIAPGAFICVGETKPVTLAVSSPSTYSYKVTLSAKTTTGTAPVIQILDSEGAPILAGDGTTTLFSGKGTTDIAKNLLVKGLSPGTACLTATYYDSTSCKSDAIKFTVMNLLTLKATDKANDKNVVEDKTTGTDITPVLTVWEGINGKAKVILNAVTDPATEDVLRKVLYRIDGMTSDPPSGTFDPAAPTEITLTPTDGNRKYTISAGLDCDNNGTLDAGEITRVVEVVVGKVEIVVASDYMVPRSMDNIVRYRWDFGGNLSPDSAVMEVYDRDGVKVRTITGLPTTYVEGKDYAEFPWNACKDSFGNEPLTEGKSPYRIVIVLKKGESEGRATLDGRNVKEWAFEFTISDKEAFPGTGRSGVDIDTVTPDKIVTRVQVTGGIEETIMNYWVKYVDDAGNDDPFGANVAVTLKTGFGGSNNYLVYTTPTLPDDIVVTYTVKITSSAGGAMDKAGNEWDMDKNQSGIQRNTRWEFKVDPEGAFVNPYGGSGVYEVISD